eukprot:1835773-Amphidinium_carterae.1
MPNPCNDATATAAYTPPTPPVAPYKGDYFHKPFYFNVFTTGKYHVQESPSRQDEEQEAL